MTHLSRLQIEKFGTLSSVSFDIPTGLCVIYGPNEAGKSTLLNALDVAISGVSPRGHLGVPARDVRLTFTIVDSDTGTETHYRRTTRGLAVTHDGDHAPADIVSPWQATVDALGPWLATHGLDHQHLRAGGQALIDGRGDLADVIFEAVEGFSARTTLRDIETRMDELYKRKRGSSAIKETLAALKVAEQRENEALVDPVIVHRHQEISDQASHTVEQTRSAYHLAESHVHICQRNQTAFHDIRTYLELTAERDALSGFILQGHDCILLAGLLATRTETADKVAALATRCSELQTLINASPATDPILEDEALIDDLVRLRPEAERDQELSHSAVTHETVAVNELSGILVNADPHTLATDPYAHARSLLLSDDVIAGLSSLAERIREQRGVVQAAKNQTEEALRSLEDHAVSHGSVGSGVTELHVARDARESAWQELRIVLRRKGPLDDQVLRDRIAHYEDSVAHFDLAVESALGSTQRTAERATLESTVSKLRRIEDRERERLLAEEIDWDDHARATHLPQGINSEGWNSRLSMLSQIKEVCARIDEQRILLGSSGSLWRSFSTNVHDLDVRYSCAGSVEAILDALATRLRTTREATQLHERNVLEHSRAQQAHEQLESKIIDDDASIADMCVRLSIPDADDLPTVVSRSKRAHDLDKVIQNIRTQLLLLHHHDEQAVEETIAYIANRTLAELDLELQDALMKKVEVFNSLESALSQYREAERELHEVQNRDEAPRLAQDVTGFRLTLAEMSEEYARLAIQRHLLQIQRQKLTASQGSTTLANAGELLEKFTDGRFIALEAVEQGTDDRTVIVHRADSAEFRLDELSEGTADQVYLSLRLAGIKARHQHMVEAGFLPYPIVLDDVLLAFDDARTHAALAHLRDWSHDTQILLTSHHHAVRDAATDLGIPVISAPDIPPVTSIFDIAGYRSNRSVTRATPDASQVRLTRQEALARVREWCARRGDEVPTRRIPKTVLEAYIREYPQHAEALGL